MPQNENIFAPGTPAEARDRILQELLPLLSPEEQLNTFLKLHEVMPAAERRKGFREMWRCFSTDERIAFLAGCRDFMVGLFSETQQAALQAGARLAMMTSSKSAEDDG